LYSARAFYNNDDDAQCPYTIKLQNKQSAHMLSNYYAQKIIESVFKFLVNN